MEDIAQCFRMLELERGASPEEVANAYRELSKVWHPDRFLKESPSLQEKAREKQREINQAYERLRTHQSEQPATTGAGAEPGMGVNLPDLRPAAEPVIPGETRTIEPSRLAAVGRFVAEWVVPIVRKALQSSESGGTYPDTPAAKGSGGQAQGPLGGQRQGRGQGRAQSRRHGSGQGRGQRNRRP